MVASPASRLAVPPAAPGSSPPGRLPLLAAALPILAAALAYGSALGGGFVFDDHPAVVKNRGILADSWWQAAFGAQHSPIANRPVVCLSLVLNHMAGGVAPFGYRLVNVVLHLVNTLLVLVVVRRALLAPNLRGIFSARRAAWTSAAIATLWACHPLGVDAVAYVTQRTTLLMSMFLLGALHAVLRSATSPHRRWQAAAIAALALGMASKEEIAAAPLLVVLFERAFLWPSWAAMRARVGFYAALASTWLVLIVCVWLGPKNPTVGWQTIPRSSAFEWLCTQATVVLHYVALSLWPSPLRGAYDWPIERNVTAALLPGAVLLAALSATAWLFLRRPWQGWLPVMFFLLLAPTSSILPIVTEVVAERRAYLPMLCVIVPVVAGAGRLLQRAIEQRRPAPRTAALAAAALAVAVAAAAVVGTRSRVAVYGDEDAFWTDAFAKNTLTNRSFQSAQILGNQGMVLHEQGRLPEAYALFERAMACEAPTPIERLHYATALDELGHPEQAEPIFRAVLREAPDLAEACGNLATLLMKQFDAQGRRPAAGDARLAEAEQLLRHALAIGPERAAFHNTLGWLLAATDRLSEAETSYRRALALQPQRAEPYVNLADVLQRQGKLAEADAVWQQLLLALPQNVELRLNRVRALLQRRDIAGAVGLLQEVLRIDPGHAQAKALLEELSRQGR